MVNSLQHLLRSSSISLTPTNSSISGDDIDTRKTLPKREKEHHGGAGDNIGRNFHDQSPTSRQGTAPRRRIPRQSKGYGTPQAPPKTSMWCLTSDDRFAFDDIDVLLYTFKELYDLVEAERFVCDPAIMAPFHDLSPGIPLTFCTYSDIFWL
uniref:Uncharacterized protein n=1 Tax=Panagrolaimus davidi TaxID=227884 RepID=A0A914QQE4_9BILA